MIYVWLWETLVVSNIVWSGFSLRSCTLYNRALSLYIYMKYLQNNWTELVTLLHDAEIVVHRISGFRYKTNNCTLFSCQKVFVHSCKYFFAFCILQKSQFNCLKWKQCKSNQNKVLHLTFPLTTNSRFRVVIIYVKGSNKARKTALFQLTGSLSWVNRYYIMVHYHELIGII